MWYYNTPIGKVTIDKRPDEELYFFAFNGIEGDRCKDPKVLVDNAFCHCVGVWEWDSQSEYDVPQDIKGWSWS